MDKNDLRDLKRRYLIWLYKAIKEAFDRKERKFTQLDIDKFMLDEMNKELGQAYLPHEKENIQKHMLDFIAYIENKEKDCAQLRGQDKEKSAEFIFMDMKLQAVEKAIVKELGKRELARIKRMYEKEMTRRILEEKEHE